MLERLIRLGSVKKKKLDDDFDSVYSKYKNKAINLGHDGEIKFIKEHGKIIIYVKCLI